LAAFDEDQAESKPIVAASKASALLNAYATPAQLPVDYGAGALIQQHWLFW
jgi:hypothetical protein